MRAATHEFRPPATSDAVLWLCAVLAVGVHLAVLFAWRYVQEKPEVIEVEGGSVEVALVESATSASVPEPPKPEPVPPVPPPPDSRAQAAETAALQPPEMVLPEPPKPALAPKPVATPRPLRKVCGKQDSLDHGYPLLPYSQP